MSEESRDPRWSREFWSHENLQYATPHFRLRKIARVVNGLSRHRTCSLLDVGCGPAALARLLDTNIQYYGVDVAIQTPAPNLVELDLVRNEFPFGEKLFDMVVASGFFEYVGGHEAELFRKIHGVTRRDGVFVVSYINFDHIHHIVTPHYSNVRPIAAFRQDLSDYFEVRRCFPVSYNWRGTAPRRPLLTALEMRFDLDIPVAGRLLGVEYLFVCSPRREIPTP